MSDFYSDDEVSTVQKSEVSMEYQSSESSRRSSNFEVTLSVEGDGVRTDSISTHNVKLGSLMMRTDGSDPTETTQMPDEEIIKERIKRKGSERDKATEGWWGDCVFRRLRLFNMEG